MQTPKNKYDGNPLGLPPAWLQFCENLGKMAALAYVERQKNLKEAQIVDTDYEVVEPKQLPPNTDDWGQPENDHWDNC
jgi:hypothetical protein